MRSRPRQSGKNSVNIGGQSSFWPVFSELHKYTCVHYSWTVCAHVLGEVAAGSYAICIFGFSRLDSLIIFCYSCFVRYPWREVCHLCLAIKPRVCFHNLSLSRLRCSGVDSAYGWVTILLYCLWLNEHIHYILTGYRPTLSLDSLTAGR
jgi:hypothetical protein